MQRHRTALFSALVLIGGTVATTAATATADDQPVGTPERTGRPASIAVLGDSISVATGTGRLGAEVPNNSWSTGTNATVNSTFTRLQAIQSGVTRSNQASNGRRMTHMASQATSMPATTQYVQVQLGGNDLCRDSVAEMTPVEEYRAQFVAGLEAIAQRAPEALVFVASVPDIYNLWYIRYAPAELNGQESDQAAQARAYVGLGIIPCLALLANPASIAPADMERREQVRQHNIALNAVLAEECAKMLRCLYDGGATFALSSNRDGDPISGPLLPREQWAFTDLDISRNTISGCPVLGIFVAGCGDHFHPSLAGLAKLSEVAWTSAYDWGDGTAPGLASATIDPAANEAGWNNTAVTVNVAFVDDAGVRGIEHRVHAPDGSVGPWAEVLGDTAAVAVVDEGVSHVEVRALDVNGNQSASQFVTVRIDTADPTIQLDVPGDGQAVLLGEAVAASYSCADDLSGVASCAGPVADGADIDTSTPGAHAFTVDAVDVAGNTASVTHGYAVHYAFSGFAPPLGTGNRTARANAVVPVRFTLVSADGTAQTGAAVEVFLVDADGVETPATRAGVGGNVALWDADEGQYVFALSTAGLASGVWEIVVRPDDGTEHRVDLTIR